MNLANEEENGDDAKGESHFPCQEDPVARRRVDADPIQYQCLKTISILPIKLSWSCIRHTIARQANTHRENRKVNMPPKLLTFPILNASHNASVHVRGPGDPAPASAPSTPTAPMDGAGIPKASPTMRANICRPESRRIRAGAFRNNSLSILVVNRKARTKGGTLSLVTWVEFTMSTDEASCSAIREAVPLADMIKG